MKTIGVVTAIPAPGTKPGTGAAISSFHTTQSTALEITGKCSAGAGDLVLLRWHGDIGSSGEWRPWKQDRPITADAAATAGYFSGVYYLGTYLSNHWLILRPGGVTLTDCYAQDADYQRGG